MTKPKNNKSRRKNYGISPRVAKRDRDRNTIALLYLQGVPPSEFVERTGLKSTYCKTLLIELREQWKRSNIKAFDERLREEILKIAMLEAEAWKQYFASAGAVEVVTTRFKDGGESKATKERNRPDRSWFDTVQWCIQQRCKLLGLDKPPQENQPPSMENGQQSHQAASNVAFPSDEEIASLSDEKLKELESATLDLQSAASRFEDLQKMLDPSNN